MVSTAIVPRPIARRLGAPGSKLEPNEVCRLYATDYLLLAEHRRIKGGRGVSLNDSRCRPAAPHQLSRKPLGTLDRLRVLELPVAPWLEVFQFTKRLRFHCAT